MVKPKLLAGSQEEEIQIMGHNIRGFPSSKDNLHKLKKVQNLLQKKDGAIVLETGVNEN